MQIFHSILSWAYRKNYEFDHLDSMKRDMVFFGGMILIMVLAGVIPAFLMIIGRNIYSAHSYLILILCFGGLAAFRIPYMNGKLDAYIPEDVRADKDAQNWKKQRKERAQQQHYEETAQKLTEDWRIPYLKMLGLNAPASPDEIKVAYRKKAMVWHPDRNKSPNAEETFKKIKEAYEKLTIIK